MSHREQGKRTASPLSDWEVVREPGRFQMTGLSRVQWWRLEREGKVPRRIPLSTNSVGWLRHEIEAWIKRKAAGR